MLLYIYGMWLLQQSHQTSVIKVSQLGQAIKTVRIALVSFLRFAQAQPIFNLPRHQPKAMWQLNIKRKRGADIIRLENRPTKGLAYSLRLSCLRGVELDK